MYAESDCLKNEKVNLIKCHLNSNNETIYFNSLKEFLRNFVNPHLIKFYHASNSII